MGNVVKGAIALIIVSLALGIGALLLQWGLGGQDIPRYWEAVSVLLGTYWIGWAFTSIYNRRAEWTLIPLSSALCSLGWLEIVRFCMAYKETNIAMHQAMYVALAMGAFIAVCLALRDYRSLEDYKYLMLFGGIAFQVSLLIIGSESHGAKLWIEFGGIRIQPIEFVKILIAIFLASYLRQFRNWIRIGIVSKAGRLPLRALCILGLGMALAEGLLVLQRDLGMALLLFGLFISLFYISTGRVDLVSLGAVLTSAGAYVCYRYFDHVQTRVNVWLDPFADINDKGYQMCQSLYALANGGLDGTGLGLGMPDLIPDGDTDFIFSAIGEELGLIGLACLILIMMLLFSRAFKISMMANNEFGMILAGGLACLWSWQSLIVMWGCTKMMPMTGITLPFVSRGGSSLVANFVIMAILWRISWPEEDFNGH